MQWLRVGYDDETRGVSDFEHLVSMTRGIIGLVISNSDDSLQLVTLAVERDLEGFVRRDNRC